MKMQKIAWRYLELIKKGDTTTEEFYHLSRLLAVKGLDPKHKGVEERALILDNRATIKAYIKATKYGKCPIGLKIKLAEIGITKPNRKRLQAILNGIAKKATHVDRLKRPKMDNPLKTLARNGDYIAKDTDGQDDSKDSDLESEPKYGQFDDYNEIDQENNVSATATVADSMPAVLI